MPGPSSVSSLMMIMMTQREHIQSHTHGTASCLPWHIPCQHASHSKHIHTHVLQHTCNANNNILMMNDMNIVWLHYSLFFPSVSKTNNDNNKRETRRCSCWWWWWCIVKWSNWKTPFCLCVYTAYRSYGMSLMINYTSLLSNHHHRHCTQCSSLLCFIIALSLWHMYTHTHTYIHLYTWYVYPHVYDYYYYHHYYYSYYYVIICYQEQRLVGN